MKLAASILLVPFTIFLTETAVLPLEVKSKCSKISCMKMKEMKCHGETKDDKKPQGNCNSNAGCSLCPVCFMFIFQAQYEWLSKHFLFERNYHPVNTAYASSYIPAVWKPPNS